MNKTPKKFKFFFLVMVSVVIFLSAPISLPPNGGDFQAYWSSAYLFSHGMDFSDEQSLYYIERTLTNWKGEAPLNAWFSPIGNIVLIPFTLISFAKAFYFWLLANIGILFSSTLIIWGNSREHLWIPLLAVFSFSMTTTSLAIGQINTLGIFGLALFIALIAQNRPFWAGFSLILTTIKPHLVIITLPILLLEIVKRKQSAVLVGLTVAFMLCFVVLFAIYPQWLQSSLDVIFTGIAYSRETPNLNGLLVHMGKPYFGKIIWLIALPSAIIWWWRKGHHWNQRTFIDVSVTVGLIISPIGWSYDQILLLFPILSILSWIANNELSKKISFLIVLTLVSANLISYYQRTLILSDLWFFWIPILILAIYIIAFRDKNKSSIVCAKDVFH